MHRSRWFVVCLLLATLCGCATRWTFFGHATELASTGHAAAKLVPAAAPGTWKVGRVDVSSTAAARDRLAAVPGFNAEDVSAAIRAQLQAHHLFDETSDARLSVVIASVEARPTTNAVVFGYHLSIGAIVGDVTLLSSDNQAMQISRVEARASLTRAEDTAKQDSFRPLYQRFAEATYRRLTGAAEPVAVNR